MEDHPGLHRGQGVDVLDGAAVTSQTVHTGLVQPGQREVRRGAATGARLGAVFNDFVERGGHLVGEGGDGGLVVQSLGVLPDQFQVVVFDPADHVQHVLSGVVRADVGVQAGGGPVELAEVVEADRRLDRLDGTAQVAQGAVADALAGDRPQLFLDRLEGLSPVLGRQVQGDGEQGGEPADRAGQVDPVEQILPTVALQVDQHPVPAGPAGQYPAECGQQHVVDLGAVHPGHVLQQRPSMVRVQLDGHRPGRRDRVVPIPVHRQRRVHTVGDTGPVAAFAIEPAGPRVLGQPVGPLLE